jgi:HD-GYP domain-containing protein (c-di-GMP phosphodiesterase class II)
MPDTAALKNDFTNTPIESNVYASHLAEVNTRRQVIAKDDIYNDRDVLLVKKGSTITPTISHAIALFKLVKPIQDSVAIQNEVMATELLQKFLILLQEDAALAAIHKRYAMDSLLAAQCHHYETLPMLRQKITVMSEQMGETFQRTLLCAWFSLLIAKEMQLAPDAITHVFLAALSHDIGMLHINPETLNKKGQLNAEEWRQIQAHVVIGQKILEATPQVPKEVCIAVLEHHERCDGTGYPAGKVESELSPIGQIIALCDSIIAVYFNRLKAEGRGWRDIIPIIQMNNQAYLYRNYEVLVTLLRRCELPPAGVVNSSQMHEFIAQLIVKNEQLGLWFFDLQSQFKAIGFTHGERKLHALQNVMLHIATSVSASGLFQEGFVEWLEQVQQQKLQSDYRAVEDIYLMQEEVFFHLQRLSRMVQLYLTSTTGTNKTLKELLESCVEISKRFLTTLN